MHVSTKLFALGALVALLAVPATSEAQGTPACTATTESQLTVKAGEQEIRLTVSEELTGEVTASFPEASKITVSSVTRDGAIVVVKVDASASAEGTHQITLSAGTTECKGDVKVAVVL